MGIVIKNHKQVIVLVLLGLATPGCNKDEPAKQEPAQQAQQPKTETPPEPPKPTVNVPDAPPIPDTPKGLEKIELTAHEHNPTTPEKVALGRLLFFDKRLSDNGQFACVSCHFPDKGWTDNLKVSPKAFNKMNTRHSPTLYNVGYAREWYWDGRKSTLEDQIAAAWDGQVGGTPDKVAAALAKVPEYAARFQKAFGEGPTPDNIPKALAAFLRIDLRSGDAPWDRYEAGDKTAASEDAIKGYEVFNKLGCSACHTPPLFTDVRYHNVGVGYMGAESPDPGRAAITKNEAETGAFKTPGLRNVTLTAPYFHDGSAATLDEAVDFMLSGGYREGNKHIDPALKPVKLTVDERAQLMAFLQALTSDAAPMTPPTLP